MNCILKQKQQAIISLCHKYNVSVLYIFGSSVNREDNNDFDFIVRFSEIPLKEYADVFFNLKNELEFILGRKVDLIEEEMILNPYFKKEIESTREKIYG